MRLRERPLDPSATTDRRLYVPRPKLEAAIAEPVRSGRNVLLVGEAGSGKSSLLNRVATVLREHDVTVVRVRGTLAQDAASLLEQIARAMDAAEGLLPGRLSVPAPDQSTTGKLLRAVARLKRSRQMVIVIDDLFEPTVGFDLFGRLRDELWELDHSWLVAVRPRESAMLRTPPADAFWARVVEVPELDDEQTIELLERGLDQVQAIKVQTEERPPRPLPRSVIRWATDVLDADPDQVPPTPGRPDDGLLNRSELAVLQALDDLRRPTTAHDAELLERLGWSRAYAQRILAGLESRGLVRSEPEKTASHGRPRKLYERNRSAA